jgi:hypothetical protein
MDPVARDSLTPLSGVLHKTRTHTRIMMEQIIVLATLLGVTTELVVL